MSLVQSTSDEMYWKHGTKVENLDGVSWKNAPCPRRFHRCRVQTRGVTGWINPIERCACGASRMNSVVPGRRDWIYKNETRKFRRKTK